MQKRNLLIYLLVAILLEVGLVTFCCGMFGYMASAIVLALVSISVGVGFLYFVRDEKNMNDSGKVLIDRRLFLFFTTFFIGYVTRASRIFTSEVMRIDLAHASNSDVIPQVTILVTRLLHGEFPYKVISDWATPLSPTYLPMQWLPFVLGQILMCDYRWIASGFLLLVICWLLFRQIGGLKTWQSICAMLFPILILWSYERFDKPTLGLTIEPLIAGYYLLLAGSLLCNWRNGIVAAIICCLLSRFAVVFWVPLFFFVLFILKEYKYLKISLLSIIIAVLCIYVIPFWMQDTSIFSNGLKYHTIAATAEWVTPGFTNESGGSYHLFKGIGLASWFHRFGGGEIVDRLKALQLVHFLLSSLTPVLLGFLFYKQKARFEYNLFLLAALKIYLTIFYTFIQIPYSYLWMTPLFVDFAIVLYLLRWYHNRIDSAEV